IGRVLDCDDGQQPCANQKLENERCASEFEASERVGGESTESHVHEGHSERDDRAVLQCCRDLTRLLRDPAAKRSPDVEALRNRTREDVVEVGHRRLLRYEVAGACKELVLTLETGVEHPEYRPEDEQQHDHGRSPKACLAPKRPGADVGSHCRSSERRTLRYRTIMPSRTTAMRNARAAPAPRSRNLKTSAYANQLISDVASAGPPPVIT